MMPYALFCLKCTKSTHISLVPTPREAPAFKIEHLLPHPSRKGEGLTFFHYMLSYTRSLTKKCGWSADPRNRRSPKVGPAGLRALPRASRAERTKGACQRTTARLSVEGKRERQCQHGDQPAATPPHTEGGQMTFTPPPPRSRAVKVGVCS